MNTLRNLLFSATLLFCGIAISAGANPQQTKEGTIQEFDGIAGTINNTILGLLQDIPQPLSLPDPLNFNFNEVFLNGDLTISDISIDGLHKLLIPYLTIVGTNLNIFIDLPILDISAKYDTNLTALFGLNIFGKGAASINIKNIFISLQTGIDLTALHLKDFHIKLNLENIKIDITGLFNDDDISEKASQVVSALANVLIGLWNQNADNLSDIISPSLEKIINDFIDNIKASPPNPIQDKFNQLSEKLAVLKQ